ncbi:E3 ubiquitin-protein ligase RGLG5-like [Ananas comosus]|uniref:E3 ubiquitin-protein ligase RGLG5-like n=1 Tax=Ananas comosus TaxID=4615 RepID=A0A6P5EXU8_ANACO|nr:E3 ubiquitin-protein ligase RGLG5-like [Ananas comosus]
MEKAYVCIYPSKVEPSCKGEGEVGLCLCNSVGLLTNVISLLILCCSDYLLSIVPVGVGDGPWETTMKQFDGNIYRVVHWVIFRDHVELIPESRKDAQFALAALMEIPSQYKPAMDLQLLGNEFLNEGECKKGLICLPPPIKWQGSGCLNSKNLHIQTAMNKEFKKNKKKKASA